MDRTPQPGVDDLLPQVLGAVELMDRIQIARGPGGVEAVDVDIDVVGAEVDGQHLGDRGRDRAVCRRILGVIRRGDQRPPADLLDGGGIAVVVAGTGPKPSPAGLTDDGSIAVTGRQKR